MAEMNRRAFLKTGSVAAATAGAFAVIPISSASGSSRPPAGDHQRGISDEEAASFNEPLFLQLRNLKTGEMSLLIGEKEIVYHDRPMANRIYRATH